MKLRRSLPACALVLAGCYTADPVVVPPGAGVVFTYPVDQQRDEFNLR